jgi:DNA (cytosine-5)-methyltransferase 1
MDLFAGCGGMTAGFVESYRFVPAFAVESESDAAATYAANFDPVHLTSSRIEDVTEFRRSMW